MDPRKPHFYKLILKEGIRYNILRFPTKFIMKYGVEISSEVNLRIPDGRTFVVEVAKFEDHNVCLVKEGWKQFTDHYSLKPCQVLLFQYEGDSSFGVFIFDKSATEIDYPNLTTCHHEKGPNSNKQEEEAKDANQIPADDDEGDHQEPNKEDDAVKNDGDLAELGTFKKLTLIDDEGDHEEPIKEKEGDQDDNSVEAVHQINDQAPADEELNEEEQEEESEDSDETFSLEEEESDEIFSLEKEDEDTSVLNQTREEPSRKKRGRPRKEHKKTTSKKSKSYQ
ncbi:hypothetical protein COLO4_11858 [Corchorus olitorius]|uniref:TF-B3 domain-containing protein n=1 Tax=Corchorus olitorius TaxID=93759 RepID=A0A1R3K2X6_9ROSI|nr:hypothetical protein COLO4_11858 [Corchorus olitorius]